MYLFVVWGIDCTTVQQLVARTVWPPVPDCLLRAFISFAVTRKDYNHLIIKELIPILCLLQFSCSINYDFWMYTIRQSRMATDRVGALMVPGPDMPGPLHSSWTPLQAAENLVRLFQVKLEQYS